MEKWKLLLQQAQTAAKAAQDIYAKGSGPEGAMTTAEREQYEAKHAEAVRLKGESDTAKKDADSQDLLKSLAETDSDEPPSGGTKDGNGRWQVKDRPSGPGGAVTFGERFTGSEQFKAFEREYPNGISKGSPVDIKRVKVGERGEWGAARGSKALTFGQARTQPTRMPTVDLVDRDRLSLLDLIDTSGSTDGDFDYVQVTGVTRNAKIVGELTAESPEEDLKPVSDMTTQLADAKVYTYADGYDVTNKLLRNAPAFATYMNGELTYSLDNLIEEKLLNGSGTDGEPRGILTTTGVQSQTYVSALDGDGMPTDAAAKAFIRATRLAILKVTRLQGGSVTGIALSPEMDAAMDLLQDEQGRYFSGGPFSQGPNTLWGRPRVTSERLISTHAVLGDWRQVALLDHEGLSVMVFNQHKDYAQRNLNYVRGELSAAQAIWKPNRLAHIRPAA